MFDLEAAIADWRKQMLAVGIKTPVPLEELEVHLRENIEHHLKTGLSAPAAFNLAGERMGHGNRLHDEFAKVCGMNRLKRRKLAGCFYAVILGGYTATAICAMYKNQLSSAEWLSGLAAQAVLLLGSFLIWWNGPRIFPLIGSRRVQSIVGLLGGISGAVWFIVFANCILPRFNFTTCQLTLAILWAMVPTLVLPTTAFLFLENSETPQATTGAN